MKRKSAAFSAGTRLPPTPNRLKQPVDKKRGSRQDRTLHTGGVTGSIPVAPTIARGICNRRVAQWQSAPSTWERSGVRFPFAPTAASAYPFDRKECGGADAVDAYRQFRSSSRGRVRRAVLPPGGVLS